MRVSLLFASFLAVALPAAVLLVAAGLAPTVAAQQAPASSQCYEIRTYLVDDAQGEAVLDRYLAGALLPALERQSIGPVGVLYSAPQDENPDRRLVVVIPLEGPGQLLEIRAALAADASYQAAAGEFMQRGVDRRAYRRIVSELAVAMDCWKRLVVPEGTLANSDRVYELRTYESPTEGLGLRKVEMFNSGEVPIFLDSGIQPVFIGQTLIGPQMPSLTYLTVYPSDEERLQAWAAFRVHPDWKTLSADKHYAGTVNRIDKYVLLAKPYSQL